MSTRLLLISDTHVPARARELPRQLWDAVDAADVVIHAGDWTSIQLLDELGQRAARLVAVRGNNDTDPEFAQRLPELAELEIEGIRVAVVHETGAATGRELRCAARFPDTDVLVFGHSHIPWDSTAGSGLRLLNPGSPTDRRRQPHGTFVTALAQDGQLREVTFVAVPR
ncbi:MAG: metallophosphoesterase family protein [Acidobacteria bacterium]|nr:metallophosphoesterase family protein [Acidobacteriota bacterium]